MACSIRLAFTSGAVPALVAIGTLVAGFGIARPADAGPAESVYTPIVDYREWELELKSGVQDWGDRERGENAYKIDVGYGVAPRWFTELVAEYTRTPGTAGRVEEYEWENIIQMTEHGEHWLDAGV
ncbi:MAG: hypothetical protein WBW61_08560, partial [Rhodanobacteraceae bacterium]